MADFQAGAGRLTARGPSLNAASLDRDDASYPGSKSQSGVWQWICDRIPFHVYYAEPFVGKGAVFRHKAPALRSWLIDSDPHVSTWWARQARRGGPARHSGRWQLECFTGCGIRFVELAAEWQIDDLLIYADPPYPNLTRSGGRQYRREMTNRDHARLLEAACACRGPVMISSYYSRLYDRALADWEVSTRDVLTRGGTLRTECLWTNRAARAAPPVSMQYSEFGVHWRERERVGRKVKRWRRNFSRCDDRERRAILLKPKAFIAAAEELLQLGDVSSGAEASSPRRERPIRHGSTPRCGSIGNRPGRASI